MVNFVNGPLSMVDSRFSFLIQVAMNGILFWSLRTYAPLIANAE